MNRSQYFVEDLLEKSQRKVCIQNKTIKRLEHELESLQRDYAKMNHVITKLNTLYEGIPEWVRKFCKWRNR